MKQVVLKNYMETLLMDKLNEVIDQLDCCKCDKCKMDIMSYALNRLPPKYVATYEGQVYSKLDTLSVQYETDLMCALYQAAKVVGTNPHHNKESDDLDNLL